MKSHTETGKSYKETGPLYKVEQVAEHNIAMRKLIELFPDSITMSDATKDLVLLVTDEHVRDAVPKDPSRCAVSVCAQRQGMGALIGRNFAFIVQGTHVTRYKLQKDAQIVTGRFDDDGTMTPGPVMLSAIPPCDKYAKMKKRTNLHRTHSKRKAKTISGKQNRKAIDNVRRSVSTRGFRTWEQVYIPRSQQKTG